MKGKLIHAIENGTLGEFLEQEGHALNRAELRIVLTALNMEVESNVSRDHYMIMMANVGKTADEQIYN